MKQLACNHNDFSKAKFVCRHLLVKKDSDYCQWFTGKGKEYNLICLDCQKKDKLDIPLVKVCQLCFQQIEQEGYWETDKAGIRDKPEIKIKKNQNRFNHQKVQLKSPLDSVIVSLKPTIQQHQYFALTESKAFYLLDFDKKTSLQLPDIPNFDINFSEDVFLDIDPQKKYAILANSFGQHALIWKIDTGELMEILDRGDYHIEHCCFPLAFFQWQGRSHLIHATDWNKLDITDLDTGQIVTYRDKIVYQKENLSSKYLDYFHCSLAISPDNDFIIDNGWVWHPCGIVVSWSLKDWMNNIWESENGRSKRNLLYRNYYWDGAICWINHNTVAIWGYGNDDLNLIPAVCIVNVETGKMLNWFPGPDGDLYFNQYLYACGQKTGTSVWDIKTEERLVLDEELKPTAYHSTSNTFLTILPDNKYILSQLKI